ncbi:stealth family protein [Catellatospora sp. TT07R-123]|uniref:stealth family protein n=1 Tax=Catellatospora sp. TT07R-123 TaxID=2733863 RepID=UPI001BB2FB68|nr:stealth family protein [Catellatospora sp. TT07R-123]
MPARLTADATPLSARELALNTVLSVVREAGVDHFCVRPLDDRTSAVGISSESRRAVLRALRRLALQQPIFVAPVTDDGMQGDPLPATSNHIWRLLAAHRVIRCTEYLTEPTGRLLLGPQHGCDLEVWSPTDHGTLRAPRPNRVADTVPAADQPITLRDHVFTRLLAPSEDHVQRRTRTEFAGLLLDDICFPIDVVYTWVDDTDPVWQARQRAALTEHQRPTVAQATDASRFGNHDELRYSLRSLHLYAPWVRRIWLVTDDQVPRWLAPGQDQVTVVSHKELFGDRGRLPTFNSHAIETQLHRIDGLSDHFLYFNDDVFLGRPLTPGVFFQPNGLSKLFPSRGKVEPGPVDPHDLASTAAGKNNRDLIMRDFGWYLTYKMKHVPHPLRRDVLVEMQRRYAAPLETTAANQFRDPADVSLPSSAYHYYALATGRAAIGRITSGYVNLAAVDIADRLHRLSSRRAMDVFCINDDEGTLVERRHRAQLLARFLNSYFPVAAPWELPDHHRTSPRM